MLARHCQALESIQSMSVEHAQPTGILVVNPGQHSGPGIQWRGYEGGSDDKVGDSSETC